MAALMTESELLEKLQLHFQHKKFRSKEQHEAVRSVIESKHDVYVSMPTGSGKSLVYQLPATVAEGKVTIVVSPLIALIKDQIEHLQRLKIVAESINSKMGEKDRKRVIDDLNCKKPRTRLLYVTPEQCATNTFKGVVQRLVKFNKLAHFVVDEAHCVSQWGHDFRPDYLKLGQIRKMTGNASWVALTATAPEKVVEDILSILKLRQGVKRFKIPCFRKNLFYDVKYKDVLQNEFEDLKCFINTSLGENWQESRSAKSGVGIIYCRTRDGTEVLANQLSKRGIPCKAYHAGLKAGDRSQVQEDWMDGKVPVITATISFGMGVDKASVRFVVHWSMAQSVASYYQESGRAGRDGRPAFARIYYSAQERDTTAFLLRKDLNATSSESKKKKLQAGLKSFELMVKYCETVQCRHAVFSRYFGDAIPTCRNKCDACKNPTLAGKALEQFCSSALRGKSFITTPAKATSDGNDLYGGGRQGQKRAAEDYGGDNSDDNGEGREERAKKALQAVISKQFKLRKGASGKAEDDKSEQEEAVLFAKVKSAEFTTNKIAGLDVKTREDYMGLVESCLATNYSTTKNLGDVVMSVQNILQAAIEAEYQVFTSNKVVTMYRKKMATLITSIKADTKKLDQSSLIINFCPTRIVQDQTKTDKKCDSAAPSQTHSGSVSACQSTPPSTKKANTKFRIKRENESQRSLHEYFSLTESPSKRARLDISVVENDLIDNHQAEASSSRPTSEAGSSTLSSGRPDNPTEHLSPHVDSDSADGRQQSEDSGQVNGNVGSVSNLKYDNVDCHQTSTAVNSKADSHVSPTTPPSNHTMNKIEEEIARLKKDMSEGMDQISYVHRQKALEKEEKLRGTTRANSGDGRSKPNTATAGASYTTSPQPPSAVGGHRPASRSTKQKPSPSNAKQMKELKVKVADELIQVLLPFRQTGRIGDKAMFKVIARELTHKVLKYSKCPAKLNLKELAERFFSCSPEIKSEEDAKKLVKSFKLS